MHGPWAVVAGASEGIGAAFSRELARRGFKLVLLARRRAPLDALAAELNTEVVVHTVDLGTDDALEEIRGVTDALDIGLLIYNAAFSPIGPFLDVPLAQRLKVIDVNCKAPVRLLDHFATRMVQRGSGGLLIMSSMSGFQGSALVATYAASKAFLMVLGESLWEELQPANVDVLVCVAGATLTPGFQDNTPADRQSSAFPMTADAVATGALARIRKGPTWIPGAVNQAAHVLFGRLLPRATAVRFISGKTRELYGDKE